MSPFNRGSARVTADVDVSASAFWALLRDWPAVMQWNPQAAAIGVVKVTLKAGDDVGVLPCTRVMHLDTSRGLPPTTEEILLFADPEARRLYYTFTGDVGGIANYIATTYVDALDGGRARVTCASTFDLPAARSLSATVKWLEQVYEQQIIRGIEAAILRGEADAASRP